MLSQEAKDHACLQHALAWLTRDTIIQNTFPCTETFFSLSVYLFSYPPSSLRTYPGSQELYITYAPRQIWSVPALSLFPFTIQFICSLIQLLNLYICIIVTVIRASPTQSIALLQRSLAKCEELALPYLASLAMLSLCRNVESFGDRPSYILDLFTRSAVHNCKNNLVELQVEL